MAEEVLHVGAEFKCLDDLEAAINQYESTKYINLYRRSSRSIAAFCKRRNTTKTIPEQLKFAEIDYACIHGGKKFKTTSGGARPNQSTFQQQCPVVVKVRLSEDWQKLVVKKLTEEHNHQLSQVAYKHLPRQRRLDPRTREEVFCMLQVKADKKLIQHHVHQSTGRILTLKDLHNLGRSREADTENDLHALLYEMKKEPGSVTEVVLGTNHVLQGIYYQDHKMQQIQRAFPELMLIDAAYKLNDFRMALYVLMSVDGNGESHVIAFWIVTNEERATVAALTDIFIRLNSADQIKCIMADKEIVERDVIQEKIPHAALQICLVHTLKMFRREITCEKMGIKSEQKQSILETLQKMTYARDEDEYMKHYEALCDLNIKPVTDYVNTHWHDIRTQWVEGLKSQAANFMTSTNNRVDPISQKLKGVISKYSGMVTFFRDLKTELAVLETERNHRTLQIIQKSSAVQSSPDSPESLYLRLLTPYASRFVSTQLSSASSPTTTVPDATTTTSCTCGFWHSMSLPCKHILKKRSESGLPLYAEELVAQRWHKSYYLDSLPIFKDTAEPAVILAQQHTVTQKPLSQSDQYQNLPNPDPASTTSNTLIDLSMVTLPPKMPKRGRPKGAGLTGIGLPKKRARSTEHPVPFTKKDPADKDTLS
ncbi:uncharacterized protein LOC114480607 [Gouania willdenowi]|uniref:uncharacterized protein LOC114480607 n=1 Tax=Gouania willdenowi TaxID=441366 RepID=UPI00105480FF|nr:uncharacterized protein LOC114480607 [Gouania willdenowi]